MDRAGDVRYAYVGEDFADRPGDEELFPALDDLDGAGEYVGGEPEIRLSVTDARDSVRPDRPAMTLDRLVPYYRGALFATIALKERFGKMGARDASEEVSRYQKMVREYGEAIRRTVEMKGEQ